MSRKAPTEMWKKGIRQTMAQNIATRAVEDAYKRLRRTPDELLEELMENNTTHFNVEELRKLLLAFTRMTQDRLQVSKSPREGGSPV